MNTDDLLKDAKRTLVKANERFGWQGDEDDQAWELLELVLGRQPDYDEDVKPSDRKKFDKLIKRRVTGEPMAFIIGWVDFLDFKMKVRDGAFIPRLTSEHLAKEAIRRLARRTKPIHVDAATGIGAVAIGSALANKKAAVYGVDISKKAIAQAKKNAADLGAKNTTFLQGDLLKPLPKKLRGSVDVITIHPPYVPKSEVRDLPEEIKAFEPTSTLTDGSDDGLGLVRRIVKDGFEWLRPGGWLLIETTPTESTIIRGYLRKAGYKDVKSTHGQFKLTRVYSGRR